MSRLTSADNGEAALMKALYDEHAGPLWRYALRLTSDASRAEDVVQETLLRAWQHPEVIGDTERSARAWLFTVARNMIIDERRSPKFRNVVGFAGRFGRTGAIHLRRRGLDAGQDADRRCDGPDVADHRAVIERSYYRGWTTAQIAADLDIAEGTVKSRLHYAVRALRLSLQEMGVTR